MKIEERKKNKKNAAWPRKNGLRKHPASIIGPVEEERERINLVDIKPKRCNDETEVTPLAIIPPLCQKRRSPHTQKSTLSLPFGLLEATHNHTLKNSSPLPFTALQMHAKKRTNTALTLYCTLRIPSLYDPQRKKGNPPLTHTLTYLYYFCSRGGKNEDSKDVMKQSYYTLRF